MGNLSTGSGGNSYYDYARRGQVYCATATVTAPVIYTTAAGTGGPLIWNGTGPNVGTKGLKGEIIVPLAIGLGITTASGVAGAIGLTGGVSTAPSATTAIDGIQNLNLGFTGGPASNVYRVGTPSAAGTFFIPFYEITTAALTTAPPLTMMWQDIGGLFVVPPGNFISVAASATLTSGVFTVGLIFAAIPLGI